MINRVILVGRLTKEPELSRTQSGAGVVSFSLAVNCRVQTPGQPEADFINCVAWNKTAELMAQYLHKGSLIGMEGRIQTRNYDNKQGQRVYVTEVVADSVQFLEPRARAAQPAQAQAQTQNAGGYQAPTQQGQPNGYSQQNGYQGYGNGYPGGDMYNGVGSGSQAQSQDLFGGYDGGYEQFNPNR